MSKVLSAPLLAAPIAVISDLHLGHPATYLRDPKWIAPLLDGVASVVFNGDTFELQSVERRMLARQQAQWLRKHCLDRKITPFFLTGNHDPFASSAHYLDLMDGKVFLTHGDILHPGVAPWCREAKCLMEERRRLLAQQPEPSTLDEAVLLTKRIGSIASIYDHKQETALIARMKMLGRFAKQPARIFRAVRYWSHVPKLADQVRHKYRPEIRLMLIGHTHRPGIWQRAGYTLVNTGSFQPLSRPLVAVLHESEALVYRTTQKRTYFARGAIAARLGY